MATLVGLTVAKLGALSLPVALLTSKNTKTVPDVVGHVPWVQCRSRTSVQTRCAFSACSVMNAKQAPKLALESSFSGIRFPQEAKAMKIPALREKKAGGALGATCDLRIGGSSYSLNWIVTIASLVLMYFGKPGLPKQFLAPLLALQLPSEAFNWIRGEYGVWCAFGGVLVRLFYGSLGYFELPLATFLLVLTAPQQLLSYRGSPGAALVALAMAAFIAYSHFQQKNENSLTTIPVLAILVIPLVALVRSR
eukprot:jgi/Mesen1/4452/ME000227S03468